MNVSLAIYIAIGLIVIGSVGLALSACAVRYVVNVTRGKPRFENFALVAYAGARLGFVGLTMTLTLSMLSGYLFPV